MSAANPFTHRIVGRSREDFVDIYTCKARGCVSHDRARSSRVPPVRRLVGLPERLPAEPAHVPVLRRNMGAVIRWFANLAGQRRRCAGRRP